MKIILLISLVACFSLVAQADPRLPKGEYECNVQRVFDGDSIGCVIARGKLPSGVTIDRYYNLRVAGIDAPERRTRQPYWQESTGGLVEKLHLKITVQVIGYDTKWRRNLISGRVTRLLPDASSVDVAHSQIWSGNAWFYRNYARSLAPELREAYENAEAEAKAAKRGLWQKENAIPPWQWRKGKRP